MDVIDKINQILLEWPWSKPKHWRSTPEATVNAMIKRMNRDYAKKHKKKKNESLDESAYDPSAKTHVITRKESEHEENRLDSAMASKDTDKYIARRIDKTKHVRKLIAFGHHLEDQNYHDEADQARKKAMKLGAKREHVYNYEVQD